jgi:hypothetical protein
MAVVTLNAAAAWLTQLLFIPLGVFVGVASLAMLSSHLFPKWICWLGLLSGLGLAPGGVLAAATFGTLGGADSISQAPVGLGVPAFWVWMLATGVLLFRRANRASDHDGSVPAA